MPSESLIKILNYLVKKQLNDPKMVFYNYGKKLTCGNSDFEP